MVYGHPKWDTSRCHHMVTRWWPTHQIKSADFTPINFGDLTFIIWSTFDRHHIIDRHIKSIFWPPSNWCEWYIIPKNLVCNYRGGGALSFAMFTHKGWLCKLVRMIYNFHKFGMCESRYDRKMQIYLKALYMTPGHLSHLFLGGWGGLWTPFHYC